MQFDPQKLKEVFKEMAEIDENPNSEKAQKFRAAVEKHEAKRKRKGR